MLQNQGATGFEGIPANADRALAAARDPGRNVYRGNPLDAVAHRSDHGQDSADEPDGNLAEPYIGKERRTQTDRALHESRKELRRLSGLLCSIQEDERRRISLDLHDGLGQTLNLIKLSLENAARSAAGQASTDLALSLQQIIPRIKEAMSEVRRVAMELRPPMLDDLGILPTLNWFLREYETTCGHLRVEKVITVNEHDVPQGLKIVLFRILQEASNNIVKHADARQVRVRLERSGDVLTLAIEDDGCGFEPDRVLCSTRTGRGLGLLSMKERAVYSGGSFHLDSSAGQGTRVSVAWPCGPAALGQDGDCALLRRCL